MAQPWESTSTLLPGDILRLQYERFYADADWKAWVDAEAMGDVLDAQERARLAAYKETLSETIGAIDELDFDQRRMEFLWYLVSHRFMTDN